MVLKNALMTSDSNRPDFCTCDAAHGELLSVNAIQWVFGEITVDGLELVCPGCAKSLDRGNGRCKGCNNLVGAKCMQRTREAHGVDKFAPKHVVTKFGWAGDPNPSGSVYD